MSQQKLFMMQKWDHTTPVIWIKDIGAEHFDEHPLIVGNEFHIKVGSERHCIGSDFKQGIWRTCVSIQKESNPITRRVLIDNIITEPYIQCSQCIGVEYFTCRKICIGDMCTPTTEIAREMCQPPKTSVYLTHVGGEVKAGVSLGIPRRWIEQGSDLGMVVAKLPGLEARRLEHQLGKENGYKLQVRNSSKIKALGKFDEDQARQELLEANQESRQYVEEIVNQTPSGTISDPSEITVLKKYYGNIDKITQAVQEIEVDEGAEFGGTIVGVKGSILVAKQDIYYYALDFKKLRARTFQFLDRPAKVKSEKSLEEWF